MPYNPYYSNLPVQPAMPMYQNQPSYMMPQQNTQQMMQPQNIPSSMPQSETLTNGGLIVVPSEEDVMRYPVAPGNFVTFKIENKPIVIEKSMSRSQFASPHYERYKLIKENDNSNEIVSNKESASSVEVYHESDIADIKKAIEHIDLQIDILKDNYTDIKKALKTNSIVKSKKEGDE